MQTMLNEVEARVLGALVEKELATPEYYPLTLNSLTTACNQKSNRDPVMSLEETEVVRALDSLKMKQLVLQSAEGGRAAKYRHTLVERLKLSPPELALLAELLLRGPQTVAELRTRAERMHPVGDASRADEVLQELSGRELVTLLPRQAGRKEQRYAHLFCGMPDLTQEAAAPPEAARVRVMAENERIASLEEEVAALRTELSELRRMMEEFRSQFE